jgi:hypothetical protein
MPIKKPGESMMPEKAFKMIVAASILAVMSLVILMPSETAQGAAYSGGDGTSTHPYQISGILDWQTLTAASGDWNGKHFVLTTDIDFNNAVLTPIGNSEIPFTGSIDGNGHVLSNAAIGGGNYTGLLGSVSSGGEIKNLGVKNININASGYYVGGLAGYIMYSSITNCYVTGNIKGMNTAGGMAGYSHGTTITGCYAAGTITCKFGEDTGGLAGRTYDSTIAGCYTDMAVTSYQCAGGLVGLADRTIIHDCYTRGSVSAENFAGGLVGNIYTNYGIANCYTISSVSGSSFVNGLARNVGTITHSYWNIDICTTGEGGEGLTTAQMAAIPHSAPAYADWSFPAVWTYDNDHKNGGYPYLSWQTEFIPDIQIYQNGTYLANGKGNYDFGLTGADTGIITTVFTIVNNGGNAITLTDAAHNYVAVNGDDAADFVLTEPYPASSLAAGENTTFSITYNLAAGRNKSAVVSIVNNDINENPYNFTLKCSGVFYIDSVEDWSRLMNRADGWEWEGTFTLENDIDFQGAALTPVGNNTNAFTGSFEGNRHVLSNAVVNGSDYVGLFGCIKNHSEIKNLGVSNISVTATGTHAGGLAGYIEYSSISDCFSTGNISGSFIVGGLAGYTYSTTLTNCYAAGVVTGRYDNTGGFAGRTYSSIVSGCYADAVVTGNQYAGGLIGLADRTTIHDCYTRGSVSGDNCIGGLVGNIYTNDGISNCYTISSVSGSSFVNGLARNVGTITHSYWNIDIFTTSEGGEGLTTAQMAAIPHSAPAYVDWSFPAVWTHDNDHKNGGYPYLSWQTVFLPDIQINQNGTYIADGKGSCDFGLTSVDSGNSSIVFTIVNNGGNTLTLTDAAHNYVDISGNNAADFAIVTPYPSPLIAAGDSTTFSIAFDPSSIGNKSAVISVANNDINEHPYTFTVSGTACIEIDSIEDWTRLMNRANGWDWKGIYILTADIDFQGAVLKPVGNNSNQFKGSFDGSGHVLSNASVSGSNYVGIFGYIGTGGEIKNLGINNINITATGVNIGGLAGYVSYGSILNCYSSGTISGSSNVGGLAGYAYNSTLTGCYSAGVITSSSSYAGGLAGRAYRSTISSCYADAIVTCHQYAGGLIGLANVSTVTDCYARGSVSGDNCIGGLAGDIYSNATINNCYTTSSVSGTTNINGLARNVGTITHSYWNSDIFTTSEGGEGLTTAQMAAIPHSAPAYVDWSFPAVWTHDNDHKNGGYPYLSWQTVFLPDIEVYQNGTITADGKGSYDFGTTGVSTGNITAVFTIFNHGGNTLTLTDAAHNYVEISGNNAADFAIVTPYPSPSIAAGDSTTFSIAFDPLTTGLKNAAVSIANNDVNENPYNFLLSGTGIAPEIKLKQGTEEISHEGSYNFGRKSVDTESEVTFTIQNTGTADLIISTPLTLSGDAGHFSVIDQPDSIVAASGDTTFKIRFKPASTGLKTAAIALNNNDSDETPYNLSIKGTGTTVLTVTGITANDKVYDGTVTAALDTASAVPVGVFAGDSVILDTDNAAGAFNTKNAGTGKKVTISGLTISGADAGYYTLIQPAAAADITAKKLTVTGLIVGNKNFDGTTEAVLYSGSAALAGVVRGDSVTLNIGIRTAVFDTKNVGTNKTVLISGFTLGGADAGNYILVPPVAAADITAKELIVTGITASDKIFDGNSEAVIDTNRAALVGIISGDDVALDISSARGCFNNSEQGIDKPVCITGLSLTGADAGNYSLAQPVVKASITGASMIVEGNGTTIPDEDNTPLTNDNTNFGSQKIYSGKATRTFNIKNTGLSVMNLTGHSRVAVSGENAGDFTVTIQPLSTITPGSSTVFEVAFSPNGEGERNAVLSITSNDPLTSPYRFAVQGIGTLTRVGGELAPVNKALMGRHLAGRLSILLSSALSLLIIRRKFRFMR